MRTKGFDFGFTDSEPMSVLRSVIKNKLKGESISIPQNPRDWEIYNKEGAEEIAAELSHDLRKMLGAIEKLTFREVLSVISFFGFSLEID